LPAGLSLSSTVVCNFRLAKCSFTSNFTVTVGDSESPAATATANLALSSVACTLTLPQRRCKRRGWHSYSTTVNAAASAALHLEHQRRPSVWPLFSSSGTISGTPTTAGFSIFTVRSLIQENPVVTVSAVLSITINISSCLARTTQTSVATTLL